MSEACACSSLWSLGGFAIVLCVLDAARGSEAVGTQPSVPGRLSPLWVAPCAAWSFKGRCGPTCLFLILLPVLLGVDFYLLFKRKLFQSVTFLVMLSSFI